MSKKLKVLNKTNLGVFMNIYTGQFYECCARANKKTFKWYLLGDKGHDNPLGSYSIKEFDEFLFEGVKLKNENDSKKYINYS